MQFNIGFCKAQMQNGILGLVRPSTILYYTIQYYSVFIYLTMLYLLQKLC